MKTTLQIITENEAAFRAKYPGVTNVKTETRERTGTDNLIDYEIETCGWVGGEYVSMFAPSDDDDPPTGEVAA